MIKQVIV